MDVQAYSSLIRLDCFSLLFISATIILLYSFQLLQAFYNYFISYIILIGYFLLFCDNCKYLYSVEYPHQYSYKSS